MASRLYLGGDKYINVDAIYADGGEPARYAMVGNQRVLIASGVKPCPTVYRVGKSFYYGDGQQPVTKTEDVAHLPEKYRVMAEEFIRERADSAKPLAPKKVGLLKESTSRPQAAGSPLVIDSEEKLAALHGGALPE